MNIACTTDNIIHWYNWIIDDIKKEEMDTIIANNLDIKDIEKMVKTNCYKSYFNCMKK